MGPYNILVFDLIKFLGFGFLFLYSINGKAFSDSIVLIFDFYI